MVGFLDKVAPVLLNINFGIALNTYSNPEAKFSSITQDADTSKSLFSYKYMCM